MGDNGGNIRQNEEKAVQSVLRYIRLAAEVSRPDRVRVRLLFIQGESMNTLDDMIRHFENLTQEAISVMYKILEYRLNTQQTPLTYDDKAFAAVGQALHATVRAFLAMC